MGLKMRIDIDFLFRVPVLCLMCMWLILGSPGLAHPVSQAKEHLAAAVGQEMGPAQTERSETKAETDGSTDSKNILEIKMMQKSLQEQIGIIVQQLKQLGETLWFAERRTYEAKMTSYRFETYFKVIMVALVVIIFVGNVIMLLFFFRRRRQIVKVLGISYDAALVLAAVKNRQLELASLIDDLQEQIEVLGIQSVPEVNSTFIKLSELLKHSDKDLLSLERKMGEDRTDRR